MYMMLAREGGALSIPKKNPSDIFCDKMCLKHSLNMKNSAFESLEHMLSENKKIFYPTSIAVDFWYY